MLRRIFDMTGGLIIGLTVAAGVHCGTAGDGDGAGEGFVADASADVPGGGGASVAEGVPAWAAHEGWGACAETVTDDNGTYGYTYTYDADGRLIETRSTDGLRIWRRSYDSLGRLIRREIIEFDGTTSQVTDYSWDC